MANIVIRGLTKNYGPVVAVRELDLEIPDGEMFFLLGPSGSGKTTTLRCIGGLEEPDEGSIEVDGHDISGLQPGQRDIGMIFQTFTLFPSMSPYANIAFPLRLQRVSKEETRARVSTVARALRIEDLLERHSDSLSDADKQRISLARALARHPRILLMDEPLTFLDAKLRMQLGAELRAIQQELGLTSVYVTHDQLEAMTMGDRLAIMHEGRVHQVGTPSEVYSHPATTFVARFVGSPTMTLLPGNLASGEASVEGFSTPLPAPSGTGAALVGFRPESCRVGEEDVGQLAGVMRIDFLEWLGSQVYVYGRAGGQEVVGVGEPDGKIEPGRSVPFSVDATQLHWFDSDTGRRIDGAKQEAK